MTPKENSRAPDESGRPVLTIDDVKAEIVAASQQVDELFAWFQAKAVSCRLQRGRGLRGQDVIDFGNPAPAEEQRIRKLFVDWQKRKG